MSWINYRQLVGGVVGRVVFCPIETVGTAFELQAYEHPLTTKIDPKPTNIVEAGTLILDSGVAALWTGCENVVIKGLVSGLLRDLQTTSLPLSLPSFLSEDDLATTALFNSFRFCLLSVITHPFSLLRTHLSVDRAATFHEYNNTVDCFTKLTKDKSILNKFLTMYGGIGMEWVGIGTVEVVEYTSRRVIDSFIDPFLSPFLHFFATSLASSFARILATPSQKIAKLQMLTGKSIRECSGMIYNTHGMFGFFHGALETQAIIVSCKGAAFFYQRRKAGQ